MTYINNPAYLKSLRVLLAALIFKSFNYSYYSFYTHQVSGVSAGIARAGYQVQVCSSYLELLGLLDLLLLFCSLRFMLIY